MPVFCEHSAAELRLIQSLKVEQIVVAAQAAIVREGQQDRPLFTLLRGWAFRYRTLANGRRQILNFLLPGDFIGVQQTMSDGAVHGVQALSEVLLCVFQPGALKQIQEGAPALAFGVTWLSAHEQSLVDDQPFAGGRRGAEERIARLFVTLFKRVAAVMTGDALAGVPFPLNEQHVADALGLTLAHTKASLRRLEKRGVYEIRDGRLHLGDLDSFPWLGALYGDGKPSPRPLI